MLSIQIKEIKLQTLINIILRDLGLRHNSVEYQYNTIFDEVVAISGIVKLKVQFGDNLDTINEFLLSNSVTNDTIYVKSHVSFSDILNNQDIKYELFWGSIEVDDER